MTSDPLLVRPGRFSFATGSVRYVDATEASPVTEARIVVPVEFKSVAEPVLAVVDTAAPWCIFEPVVAESLVRNSLPILRQTVLSTRIGMIQGALYREVLRIPADEGEPLDVEASVFLSPDWRGPNFIGYQGLLQRIRFTVDPEVNLFYFGRI